MDSRGIPRMGLLASSLFSLTSAAALDERATSRTVSLAAYYGQTGGQDRLKTFCDDNSIDIFPVGFVNGFPSDPGNNGYPETNFGNQCGGYYANTKTFLACQYFIEDVAYCQARGKKILISIGGGVSNGRITSDRDGLNFANQLWQIFGPKPCGYTGPRPFGDNVVDGFDLDIEHNGNTGVAALAAGLRAKMDSDRSKTYLLTAAPQCPIPDAQLGVALAKVRFDYVWVQWYNTGSCSARAHFDHSYGPDINFNDWVSWLRANSPSTPPKLFIGLPASASAANSGYYLSLNEVKSLLESLDSSDMFGGIMLYDAMYSRINTINSQTYASNVHALLDGRGFKRAAAIANNGYVYSCATSTTSTVTSSAATSSSSKTSTSSTTKSTTSSYTSSTTSSTASKPSSTSSTTSSSTSKTSSSTISTSNTASSSTMSSSATRSTLLTSMPLSRSGSSMSSTRSSTNYASSSTTTTTIPRRVAISTTSKAAAAKRHEQRTVPIDSSQTFVVTISIPSSTVTLVQSSSPSILPCTSTSSVVTSVSLSPSRSSIPGNAYVQTYKGGSSSSSDRLLTAFMYIVGSVAITVIGFCL